MAYVSLPAPWWLSTVPGPALGYQGVEASVSVIDAAGESAAFIGKIRLSTGPGTSKTLQSGDIIHWRAGATTFANAGTTARIGVQDPSGGVEDGSWDVYVDLTGGGGGIASGTVSSTMSTGSKVITDGQSLAIVFEFTARGGADVIRPQGLNLSAGLPYGTTDTGAGPGLSGIGPLATIEFADGTIGYFVGVEFTAAALTSTAFNSGSNPDEVASLFEFPVGIRIDEIAVSIGELDAGETGNVHLYGTPTGTPADLVTAIAVDPQLTAVVGNAVARHSFPIGSTVDLAASTLYAVSYEATSAGSRNWGKTTLPSANARKALPFSSLQGGGRQNGSGAFGSLSSTEFLAFAVRVVAIDVGSGGGLKLHPGMAGGLRG